MHAIGCTVTAVTVKQCTGFHQRHYTGTMRTEAHIYPEPYTSSQALTQACVKLPVNDVSKGVDYRRWEMQATIESTHAAVPRSHGRPILDSCDSGEEFSFYHWIEVCRLVDEGDTVPMDEGLPGSVSIEDAIQETSQKWSPPPHISTSPVT